MHIICYCALLSFLWFVFCYNDTKAMHTFEIQTLQLTRKQISSYAVLCFYHFVMHTVTLFIIIVRCVCNKGWIQPVSASCHSLVFYSHCIVTSGPWGVYCMN